MRLFELLSEENVTHMKDSQEDAEQGSYITRDVGGYDRVYHMNRMMMAMAMADGKSTKPVDSPAATWFEKYNTLFPYTKEEHNMVKSAMKTIPTDGKQVSKDTRSHEHESVNKASPIPHNSGKSKKK